MLLADILKIIDKFAPFSLAEGWDNCGLQIGSMQKEIKSIYIALDPTLDVIKDAKKQKASLIITHHPLILNKINKIIFDTLTGKIISECIKADMSLISIHTNFDSAKGCLNDALAKKIKLKNIEILNPIFFKNSDFFKLIIFTPSKYENKIRKTIFEADAGRIKEYEHCSFSCNGKASFKPKATAKPYKGKKCELNYIDEVKIETIIHKKNIYNAIKKVKEIHPYETMAYDIIPLASNDISAGLGRIGEIEKTCLLEDFIPKLKKNLKIKNLRFIGNPKKKIRKIALCTGSGSSFLNDFYNSDADLYISGDIRYHDALNIKAVNLACIDAGHFATEVFFIDVLADMLKSKIENKIKIIKSNIEEDPFIYI